MAPNFLPLKSAALQKFPKSAAINANAGNSPSPSPKPPTAIPASQAFTPVQHSHNGNQPVISIEKEGDRVARIKIQCSCGQYIELDCVY